MKKKKSSPTWLIYKIIVFYTLLSSCRACMTLGDNPYIDMALSFVCLVLVPWRRYQLSDLKVWAALLLTGAAAWTMHGSPLLSAYLAQIFMVMIPVQLLLLNSESQLNIFHTISKWFAVLLLFSMIWWLLFLVGFPLPHTSTEMAWQYNDYGCRVDNYFLFNTITNLSPWAPAIDYYRFQGFSLEPGHIGTITFFFLFANKFEFKRRRNIIFLAAIIMSLSAAAYFLLVLGYMMFIFQHKKIQVISLCVAIMVGFLIISVWNGGDNVINNIIVGKFTRSEGAVSGRAAEWTLRLWDKTIRHGGIFWGLGHGVLSQLTQSAGYIVFLLHVGIFGAVFTATAYWFIQRSCRSQLGYFMYLIFLVSWLQRVYCFWDAFLDPFILGLPYLAANHIAKKTQTNPLTQPKYAVGHQKVDTQ